MKKCTHRLKWFSLRDLCRDGEDFWQFIRVTVAACLMATVWVPLLTGVYLLYLYIVSGDGSTSEGALAPSEAGLGTLVVAIIDLTCAAIVTWSYIKLRRCTADPPNMRSAITLSSGMPGPGASNSSATDPLSGGDGGHASSTTAIANSPVVNKSKYHVHDYHANLLVWSVCMASWSHCIATSPTTLGVTLCHSTMVLAALMSTPHAASQLFIGALMLGVALWNSVFPDNMLLLPGARLNGAPLEYVFLLSAALYCALVLTVTLIVLAKHSAQQILAARRAIVITHQVVGLLERYDIPSVKAVLSVHRRQIACTSTPPIKGGPRGLDMTSMVPPSDDDDDSDAEGDDNGGFDNWEAVAGADRFPLELLKSFETMADNLESYRPFLPNYLFQDNGTVAGDSGSGVAGTGPDGQDPLSFSAANPLLSEAHTSVVAGAVSQHHSPATTRSLGRPSEIDVDGGENDVLSETCLSSIVSSDVDSASDCQADPSPMSHHLRPPSTTGTTPTHHSVAKLNGRATSKNGLRRLNTASTMHLGGQHSPLLQLSSPSLISVALIDLSRLYDPTCPAVQRFEEQRQRQPNHGVRRLGSPRKKKHTLQASSSFVNSGNSDSSTTSGDVGGTAVPSAVPSALTKVVELIFTLADETHGAVHTLTGDTATLSWNAVGSHCPQHEVKGTRFLMKLLTAVGGPGMGVSGALWSGMANHDTIFTTGRQRGGVRATPTSKTNVAQLLHAPWLQQLWCSFELAKRYSTVLVDGTTMEGIKYDYEVLAVDQVSTQLVTSVSNISYNSSSPVAAVLSSGGGGGRAEKQRYSNGAVVPSSPGLVHHSSSQGGGPPYAPLLGSIHSYGSMSSMTSATPSTPSTTTANPHRQQQTVLPPTGGSASPMSPIPSIPETPWLQAQLLVDNANNRGHSLASPPRTPAAPGAVRPANNTPTSTTNSLLGAPPVTLYEVLGEYHHEDVEWMYHVGYVENGGGGQQQPSPQGRIGGHPASLPSGSSSGGVAEGGKPEGGGSRKRDFGPLLRFIAAAAQRSSRPLAAEEGGTGGGSILTSEDVEQQYLLREYCAGEEEAAALKGTSQQPHQAVVAKKAPIRTTSSNPQHGKIGLGMCGGRLLNVASRLIQTQHQQ